MESKFQPGDRVRVVKYGHQRWFSNMDALNEWYSFSYSMDEHFERMLLWGSAAEEKPIEQKDYSYKALPGYKDVVADQSPELVGKEGVVEGSYFYLYGGDEHGPNGDYHKKQYSVKGIPGKTAWYNENQLELITD